MKSKRIAVFVYLFLAIVVDAGISFDRSECHDVTSASGLVPRDKWPWLAALYTDDTKEFFGSGSLISESFILTAAHCLLDKLQTVPKEPDDVIIYLGIWNLNEAVESNAFKAVPDELFLHPEWDSSDERFDADIAIIKLDDEVPLSSKIRPVCLWTSEYQGDEFDDSGIVVGWGRMENPGLGRHSNVIRQVNLKMKPTQKCHDATGVRGVITSRGLCVGGEGAGACVGNSGGGFFVMRNSKWYLRGLTSSSSITNYGKCEANGEAVLTNVEKFTTWIDEVLSGGAQVKCRFYSDLDGAYTCSLEHPKHLKENAKIVQTTGKHEKSRTVSNVKSLEIHQTANLPIKLSETFPNLEKYFIRFTEAQFIERKHLEGLRKLTRLHVQSTSLDVVSVQAFYDLNSLELLELYDNQIESIDRYTFMHNENLEQVFFNKNKIRFLYSELLSKLFSLKVFDISDNQIEYIDRDFFSYNTELEKIFLNNNKLRSLPVGLLRNNLNLKEFDAGFNQIESIHHNFFLHNSNLEKLLMGKNKIHSLNCGLLRNNLNLKKFNISSNLVPDVKLKLLTGSTELQVTDQSNNTCVELPQHLIECDDPDICAYHADRYRSPTMLFVLIILLMTYIVGLCSC